MKKTNLYTLDYDQFRAIFGSGEAGLAERMLKRHVESGGTTHEAELDDLEELLTAIERRGSLEASGDSKTDDLANRVVWLIAEEAGVEVEGGGAQVEVYREAAEIFGRRGWLSRPLLAGQSLELFSALFEGRVFGSYETWSGQHRTAVLDPGEVRTLLGSLRALAEARGSKLPSEVQDLLDQSVFPTLEAAARAGLGLLAVTHRM